MRRSHCLHFLNVALRRGVTRQNKHAHARLLLLPAAAAAAAAAALRWAKITWAGTGLRLLLPRSYYYYVVATT